MAETGNVSNNDQISQATKNEQEVAKTPEESKTKKAARKKSQESKENLDKSVQKTNLPKRKRKPLQPTGNISDHYPKKKHPGNEETKKKEFYSMSHKPLGYCLIINNDKFETMTLENRRGTEKDKEFLIKVFKNMYFKVEVRDDLKASDMQEVVKEFAGKNHSQMDAFVCCILTHGQKGSVLGTDGKQVPIRELTQPFAECRKLAGKPKLFFIQACQGNENQQGMWVSDGPSNTAEEGEYEEDAHTPASYKIPIDADFLFAIATVEDYISFRHSENGSIFIQELCKQLEIGCPRRMDIHSILTEVNRVVSSLNIKGSKQMPEVRYTLTKTLVLPMKSP